MKTPAKQILVVLLLACMNGLSAQNTKKEKARTLTIEAIEYMHKGDFVNAMKLLKEAKKLDPGNIDYPYEMAVAHYMQKDYKAAIKAAEPLSKRTDVNDLVFQLLGNSYSLNGQRDNAISTYERGIARFPNSGRLYLERGNVELMIDNYDDAIDFYEKGIEVDPVFPSNYYRAALMFCNSSERVWGMIYGEIFMNLERNSKRTEEMSRLLFNTYKKAITYSGDTSIAVSFSKANVIELNDPSDAASLKFPFPIIVYEPLMAIAAAKASTIDLLSLSTIRTSFIETYFEKGFNTSYPNALFEYQNQVREMGHFEAYNMWILLSGDKKMFDFWRTKNQEKWDSFISWFKENPIQLSPMHRFYRRQY